MARKKKKLVDVVAAGSLGGAARAANLSPAERKKSSSDALKARWEKYYEKHPEKWQERLEREARKGTVPRGRPAKKKAKNRP